MEPDNHTSALHQAAADVELAERQLRAIGILLAASLCSLADALKAQSKQAKATRKAARRQKAS